MKVVKNDDLSNISICRQSIDDTSDLPYIPPSPLPAKSFAMLVVAPAGGGKTSFWTSLLLSHPTRKKRDINRIYYRYFDKIILFSPSKDTLPMDKLKLDESRCFLKYNDEDLTKFIEEEKDGENLNNLILIDDSVRDLTKSKILCKTILNRRHCTQNNDEEGKAGLSIMITSQKYNMIPLALRLNMSQVIVFRTENQKELKSIKEELMGDLTKEQQDELLKLAWKDKHDFLYIDAFKPKHERYYRNFDRIEIPK